MNDPVVILAAFLVGLLLGVTLTALGLGALAQLARTMPDAIDEVHGG